MIQIDDDLRMMVKSTMHHIPPYQVFDLSQLVEQFCKLTIGLSGKNGFYMKYGCFDVPLMPHIYRNIQYLLLKTICPQSHIRNTESMELPEYLTNVSIEEFAFFLACLLLEDGYQEKDINVFSGELISAAEILISKHRFDVFSDLSGFEMFDIHHIQQAIWTIEYIGDYRVYVYHELVRKGKITQL